jgi:osmotically inducible protein OsmC
MMPAGNERKGPAGIDGIDKPRSLGSIPDRYGEPTEEVLVSILASPHRVTMKLMIRKASVRWKGGSEGGTRVTSTDNGVLKQGRRSSDIPLNQISATNPAELIAAAHAGSFSLALSKELQLARSASGNVLTTATVALEHLAEGWTIMNIHLNVIATLPRVSQDQFIDATIRAKTSCLVSRVLRANISMNAKLEK